jgi:two-component system cell cycle response regulator DivK
MNPKPRRALKTPPASILVVDDEPLNLKLFTLALTRRGYNVVQASNAYHGFVLAHDDPPDLIVMDVRLPGLSGLEVTRTLKDSSFTKDIPIIIATAFLIDEDTLLESGCDAYMPKPFVIPEFIKLIDSTIERTRATVTAR